MAACTWRTSCSRPRSFWTSATAASRTPGRAVWARRCSPRPSGTTSWARRRPVSGTTHASESRDFCRHLCCDQCAPPKLTFDRLFRYSQVRPPVPVFGAGERSARQSDVSAAFVGECCEWSRSDWSAREWRGPRVAWNGTALHDLCGPIYGTLLAAGHRLGILRWRRPNKRWSAVSSRQWIAARLGHCQRRLIESAEWIMRRVWLWIDKQVLREKLNSVREDLSNDSHGNVLYSFIINFLLVYLTPILKIRQKLNDLVNFPKSIYNLRS